METDNNQNTVCEEPLQEVRETLLALAGGRVNPETRACLDRVLRAYPYFSLGHALMIKHFGSALDPAQLEEHRRMAALGCGDRQALMGLAGPEALDYRLFYPPEEKPKKMSTSQVLEIYDSHFPTGGESGESSVIERLIFNPSVEYSEILAREEAESPAAGETQSGEQDETSRRIDNFLKTSRKAESTPDPQPQTSEKSPYPEVEVFIEEPSNAKIKAHKAAEETPEVSKSDLLSESLAKFYIKQGRYQQAFEIISSLNLKYPKKSVYFADQMRFLQKLMRLEEFKRSSSAKKPL